MKKYFIFFLLLSMTSNFVRSQENTNKRAEWFTDSRFGMFIHWGIYSGAEGYWKGEKLRFANNYAEWIKYRNRISDEEYISLIDRFAWDEIDPEKWVVLAKEAGMKYITITAKHHDGFGLWDSQSSDYDLGNYTNPKRDIIKEIAEACRKHQIRLCLYYSHWVDWEHEYGWDHSREVYGLTNEEFDIYWQEKVIPQIRELLSNYGEISMLWFDMWKHHSETVVSKEQLMQLKSLIRELQPDCLVNSRLGLSIEEDPDVDFKTLGDNQLGSKKEDFPWQSPATVAHSWGFHATDNEWKSTTTLLKSLINNVSLNGNYMLNIGPRANGDVPYEISQRLLEMGNWLKINGESIYGAGAFELRNGQHDWGEITYKKTDRGFNLYLHVFNWPLNNTLQLTGITDTPGKIYALADKQRAPLRFSHTGAFTGISLPANSPDPYVSVIVIEYLHQPSFVDGLVAKTTDGGYALYPGNQNPANKSLPIHPPSRRESVPAYVSVNTSKSMKWQLYVDEKGEKSIDVSYSFQEEKGKDKLIVRAANNELEHTIIPTGKTVGEPDSNWVIESFESHRLGNIYFPAPGYYEIEIFIQPEDNREVKFQWIWIK